MLFVLLSEGSGVNLNNIHSVQAVRHPFELKWLPSPIDIYIANALPVMKR